MTWDHNQPRGRGFVSGMLFIALGAIFLLGNLNIIPPVQLSRYWPVILILVGIKEIVFQRGTGPRVGGLLWIGSGLLFLSATLAYIPVSISTLLWPVSLIWFGVLVYFGCGGACSPRAGQGERS